MSPDVDDPLGGLYFLSALFIVYNVLMWALRRPTSTPREEIGYVNLRRDLRQQWQLEQDEPLVPSARTTAAGPAAAKTAAARTAAGRG